MLAVTPSESREVALIANPEFEAGRVAGHRARRLIDGGNPAFSDPFLLMAEDWTPRDAFSRHPNRGIETVTLVLDGALEPPTPRDPSIRNGEIPMSVQENVQTVKDFFAA